MKVVSKVVFFIDGDAEANEYQASVVEHENSQWLVATWLEPLDGTARIPEWLIPMVSLPHFQQPDGLIRLGRTMPIQLLSASCPTELRQQFGAALNPLLVRTPEHASIH